MLGRALLIALLLAASASADAADWRRMSMTSADLANEGSELLSATSLLLPGGGVAVITYWRSARDSEIYRCTDRLDDDLRDSVSAVCSVSK